MNLNKLRELEKKLRPCRCGGKVEIVTEMRYRLACTSDECEADPPCEGDSFVDPVSLAGKWNGCGAEQQQTASDYEAGLPPTRTDNCPAPESTTPAGNEPDEMKAWAATGRKARKRFYESEASDE